MKPKRRGGRPTESRKALRGGWGRPKENAELGEEEDPRSKSDAAVVAYDGIGCNRDVLPLSSRREW